MKKRSVYTKIAEKTLLNRTTVWRILNFKVRTDPQTLDAICQAAQQLGYNLRRHKLKKGTLDFQSPLLVELRDRQRSARTKSSIKSSIAVLSAEAETLQ